MTKKEIRKLSVLEKTMAVKKDMADKKFTSIEEACAFYEFSPASYYNNAKKVGTKVSNNLVVPPTPEALSKDELIEALRRENEGLKRKLEEDRVVLTRLKLKVADQILGLA